MANPFVKAWKYLAALFNSKIDEHADPKIQIQQAIEEAQRTHQALTQQAAQVIGNQRQLEMRLNRQLADIEKLINRKIDWFGPSLAELPAAEAGSEEERPRGRGRRERLSQRASSSIPTTRDAPA